MKDEMNKKVMAIKLDLLNLRINLRTTNAHSIELVLKIRWCDVISSMHCLTSLKIVVRL